MVRSWQAFVRHVFSIAFIFMAFAAGAKADEGIVRAVLFYSPSCSHCHYVITEVLPPLMDQYGSSLKIIGINISTDGGNAMYQSAVQQYKITDDRFGVPCLIIGDYDLVGDVEVSDQLPVLIEQYLAAGGVDWPPIPGLAEALAAREPAATNVSEQASGLAASSGDGALPLEANGRQQTIAAKIARDPIGNGLSIAVLLALIASLIRAIALLLHPPKDAVAHSRWWAVFALAIVGAGIAGYLAFVESTQTAAFCGPVGDCNTVQQSEFALLFGILPIGVLGLIGYVLILVAWLVRSGTTGKVAALAEAALFGMALFGVGFSTYLTFLEPFVIGATCAWCLGSAIVMLTILSLSARPGARAITSLRTPISGSHHQTDV